MHCKKEKNSREWDRQCQARYRKPKEDWTTELEKEGEKCGTLSLCVCVGGKGMVCVCVCATVCIHKSRSTKLLILN